MNNKLKFLQIFFLAGILIPLALFFLGYYFVVPKFVDFDKYESKIRSTLNRRIIYPFELGDLTIKLTWNFRARISTDNLTILNPDKSKLILTKDSYLEVSLFPLINNRVDLKKISINKLDLEIIRQENGKLNVSNILMKPEKPKYKVSLANADIIVNGYNVKFREEFIKPAADYLFKGEKIKLTNFRPGSFIKAYAVGAAVFKNKPDIAYDIIFSSDLPLFKKENLRLKGKITNLEPDLLLPYINAASSVQFISLAKKGDVKFDFEFQEKLFGKNYFFIDSVFEDIKVELSEKGVISNHAGELNLVSKGYYNNNRIFFDFLKIKGKDLDIKNSGEIKNYRNKAINNYLDLKISLSKTKIRALAQLFPKSVKLKRRHFKNILKNQVKADVSGNFSIKGYVNEPQMFGLIYYNNLTMRGGFKDTPASSGKVDFLGPEIVIKNRIFTDKENFITVKGRIAPFKEKTLNLDITSGPVDFARVRKILFTAREFFKIKVGPVKNMDFKGRGRLNINISGSFDDVKIKGYVQADGMEVKYATLAKPGENIRGKVRFMGEKVYYDDITVYVENQKISPSGYTALDGYSDVIIHIPQLKLDNGLRFVNTSPMLVKAKQALKDILQAKGEADARIHIKGSGDNLETSGKFIFSNALIRYKGFGGWFEKVKGRFEFVNENVYFKETLVNIYDSRIKVTGSIDKNLYADLKLVSDTVNLHSARNFLIESPILENVRDFVRDYTEIKGTSSVEINLKGNLEGNSLKNLVFENMNATFTQIQIGIPVSVNGGKLEITPDKVNAYNLKGFSEDIGFGFNGSFSNLKAFIEEKKPLVPDFTLNVDKFDFSKIKNFIKAPLIPEKARQALSKFDEFHGMMEILIDAKPDNISVKLAPNGISAVYKPYDAFVFIKEGEALFSNNKIDLDFLRGVFSESEFDINGFIKDYKKEPEFNLALNIDLNHNDIDKIRFYTDLPLQAGGIIPFNLDVKGNIENWNVFGKMVLEKGSYLNYLTDIGLPHDKVRLISLEATGNKDSLKVKRLRVDMSDSAEKLVRISDEDKNYEGFINLINIQGVIDNIKSKNPEFKNFSIKTNDQNSISTRLFNPSLGCLLNNGCRNFFSGGNFKTDLKLNGHVANPEIKGITIFQDIAIPDYHTHIESINLIFDKKDINLEITGVNIGESLMNIEARIDTKFETPMLIKNLQINSRLFNIDEMVKIFTGKYSEKRQESLPLLVITDGELVADKMIMNKMDVADVNASFNFTPDWLLSVSKVKMQGAQGQGQGNLYYNFNTGEMSASFDFRQMQGNTLVTALLTLPDEVYGTLDGNIRFSTRGKNYQELIANSNGYAEFEIKKGHLVRLGSLEYLLRASNVIQSGIGGLNLNNIIDLIAPKKTGHFETLKGKIYVKDGVLYTDDITSSGKILSLYISGKLDMLTNKGDIQVLGRLSRNISGMLGPVGSVSINQFIDYIPGLGFLPATPGKKGMIDLIPGLNKIPVLELSNDQKFRRFAVQINGDIYKQDSVKSFRWIE